jgi:hypothetical protein
MPSPTAFFDTLQQQVSAARSKLRTFPTEELARKSGFLKRTPRKIPIPKLIEGLLAVAPQTNFSLENIASTIGLAAHTTYSKQALHDRLAPTVQAFLAQVITSLFGQLASQGHTPDAFASFQRVLVQDSTVQTLPPHLAELFPTSGNQLHKQCASLKIQWICDLKNSAVEQVSLSGFTRNDQAASPDILAIARPGDLVIRDLGYLVASVLAQFVEWGIYFLTRLRLDLALYDPTSGQALDLKTLLRTQGQLDCRVCFGPKRTPLRLVAVPAPEEVVNQRRARAKATAKRRGRSAHNATYLFLLGWNIFLTNVPRSTWSPKTLVATYRLRWRIEMIFKTWKSHLGLRQLNCQTGVLLQLSVLTKLLFCALVCQICDALQLTGPKGKQVSLLRVGRTLAQCACWFCASMLGLSVSQWLASRLDNHSFYEKRTDRKNYYELLAA